MVEVSIGGGGQLQGPEADVVQGLVVDAERLVRVLDQLVHREGGVVGLHNGVGHLRGGSIRDVPLDQLSNLFKHSKGGEGVKPMFKENTDFVIAF